MPIPPTSPLHFSPAVEIIDKDEADIAAQLTEQMTKISERTFEDSGHALRSVHAKSHGLLRGKLVVPEGLPAVLAQGLFASFGEYPATLRFSTSPGDLLPDTVSTPRGLAIKISEVPGECLAESEEPGSQDFVLVTGKAFSAPDPRHFLKNLKMLAATTDKAEGLKVALSAVLRGAESAVEALGGESPKLKTMGGYPETHILGESFFSQVPLRYGDYVAKIGVFPVSPELVALSGATLDLGDHRDGLREAVRAFFQSNGGAWEIRVQLCTGLEEMPVEDATALWDEAASPYVAVARLEVPAQDSWSDALQQSVDESMSFSPWHGLQAHQPLGSINRARRMAYPASAHFRLQKNGCPYAPAGQPPTAGARVSEGPGRG